MAPRGGQKAPGEKFDARGQREVALLEERAELPQDVVVGGLECRHALGPDHELQVEIAVELRQPGDLGAGDQMVEQLLLPRLAQVLELDEDAEVVEAQAEDVGDGEEPGQDAAALQAAQPVAQALLGDAQPGGHAGQALAAVQA